MKSNPYISIQLPRAFILRRNHTEQLINIDLVGSSSFSDNFHELDFIMTGKFTENDPERCAHYARFFKDLTLIQAEMIFWILFMIVSYLASPFTKHTLVR